MLTVFSRGAGIWTEVLMFTEQGLLLRVVSLTPRLAFSTQYQSPEVCAGPVASPCHCPLSHTELVYPILLNVNPLRRLRKSVSRNAPNTDSSHTIPECGIQEFANGMPTMRHFNSAMLCGVGTVSLKYLQLVKQHTMTRNNGLWAKRRGQWCHLGLFPGQQIHLASSTD